MHIQGSHFDFFFRSIKILGDLPAAIGGSAQGFTGWLGGQGRADGSGHVRACGERNILAWGGIATEGRY